jgi:two-component system, OmpR family, phosphate regulon sensor histidine kinase PhoR
MIKRISSKIIIYTSLLIVSLVFFLILFINRTLTDTHINLIKEEMREKIYFIDLAFHQDEKLYSTDYLKKNTAFVKKLADIIKLRITIIDSKGIVLADSDVKNVTGLDNHLFRPEVQYALKNSRGESIRYSDTLNIDMLYTAQKSRDLILRIAKPLYEVEKVQQESSRTLSLAGITVILLSITIIIFISRKISNPIREAISFARIFASGDYNRRILNYDNDEIGTLQKSLNRLADTIHEKINIYIFEKTKLEITIESIQDGISVIDSDKKIVICNSAFKRILEIDTAVIKKIYYEVIRSRNLNSEIEEAIASGTNTHFEEEFLSGRVCRIFINPIKDESTIQGLLIVLRDITESKKIDRMKTELIGNMSHELKTPVAILRGYIETIQENIQNKVMVEELLDKAHANVERQSLLINDILKLNIIEQGPGFASEKIDLNEVLGSCMEILKPKAEKKNITIKIDCEDCDFKIEGNRFLAEEVFFNLIDNAINYNYPDGDIYINMIKNYNGSSVIQIADTGIGIPDDSVERIFERFYRVDKSRSRLTGGTGLGLSIVKHAADLLEWVIDVKSHNSGTMFVIHIPL